ncbi:hypothetical protein ACQVPP_26595 [Bacillus luti]|uniref:hypothetical protein n=1 Tax=Bacillus luti TaxID=2026191 RepID=UPI003D6491CD
MLLTKIISLLLWTVIPGLSLQVFYTLCPFLNADIPITPAILWDKVRFQVILLISALILVIALALHVYLNMPAHLTIQLALLLFQVELFLTAKLADYFRKSKDENSKFIA